MQDRFRFRAYQRVDKKMCDVVCLNSHRQKDIIVSGINDDKYFGITNWDECDIIQCSGLKDKNSELVYFDDFVKLDDGIVCIVKQIEDINDIEYGRVVAIPVFCLNQKYQIRYIPTVIAEGEKVGNLYENPELLEIN